MKTKKTIFLNNDLSKLVLITLLALVLIFVSIVLIDDVSLDNRILLYNIFGTLAIVSFLYSYSLTKNQIENKLALGSTRKDIYKNYMINISISLMIAVFLGSYYIFIYKIVINSDTSIFSLFDFGSLLVLPLLYLIFSFLGFMFGIVKMKRRFFYPTFLVIVSGVIVLIIYFSIHYFADLGIFLVALAIAYINYYLIMNYKL